MADFLSTANQKFVRRIWANGRQRGQKREILLVSFDKDMEINGLPSHDLRDTRELWGALTCRHSPYRTYSKHRHSPLSFQIKSADTPTQAFR